MGVHAQTGLGGGQPRVELFEVALAHVVFSDQLFVLVYELLVFAALVWVELVQAELHLLVDVLQLVLDVVDALFVLFALQEDLVELGFELLVLGLDVDVGVVHVFRAGVDSDFVDCEVVVGELALQVADLLAQLLETVLELVVDVLLFGDLVAFLLEVLDLAVDQLQAVFEAVDVVVAVVDLSAWVAAQVVDGDALVRYWAVHDVDVCACAHSHYHASSGSAKPALGHAFAEVVCELCGTGARSKSVSQIPHRLSIRNLHYQIFKYLWGSYIIESNHALNL